MTLQTFLHAWTTPAYQKPRDHAGAAQGRLGAQGGRELRYRRLVGCGLEESLSTHTGAGGRGRARLRLRESRAQGYPFRLELPLAHADTQADARCASGWRQSLPYRV